MATKRIDQYDPITPVSTHLVLVQNPTTLAYSKATIASLPSSGGGAVASVAGKTGIVTLDKTDVGLSNVDNTSDVNKPVSTAQATSIATREPAITVGTSAQYYRGDKTMQTLNQDAVPSGTTNKAYTATEQTKLAGVATGATANSSDATLLARANHTGTQLAATISDFSTAADARITVANSTVATLTNKTISGASNTLSSIPESAVTNLTTDLAGKQPTLTLTTAGTTGAASLVGATLNIPQYATSSGTAGIVRSVSNISANTTAGAVALTDYVYNCTGAITLTLPTAVGNTNSYTVNTTDGLTTVGTTSAQTILGSSTATLPITGMSLTFMSNNSNWVIE